MLDPRLHKIIILPTEERKPVSLWETPPQGWHITMKWHNPGNRIQIVQNALSLLGQFFSSHLFMSAALALTLARTKLAERHFLRKHSCGSDAINPSTRIRLYSRTWPIYSILQRNCSNFHHTMCEHENDICSTQITSLYT